MRTRTKFRRAAALAAALLAAGLIAATAVAAQDAAKPATDAPATAMVPTAPVAPVVTKETIDNPYGLEALWKQGDFVSRGTLMILVIMSIGSWYIGVVKLIEQARVMKDARE